MTVETIPLKGTLFPPSGRGTNVRYHIETIPDEAPSSHFLSVSLEEIPIRREG